MSDDANTLINQYQFLWQQQANFRTLWNTVAQFVMPAWDNFIGEFAEGVNRNTRIFDSTAITANARFAAAMEAMLTPRSTVWHKLVATNKELEGVPAVDRYLDQLNKILFAARYRPEAGFSSQNAVNYQSLGAFGNHILFTDEVPGKHLRYKFWPLSEVVWALSHQGHVDTIFRKFRYSPRQAMQHWGGKANIPQGIKDAYAKNPYTDKLEFLHVIRPNGDYREGAYGDEGKRFECWYVYLGDKSIIERGGYRCFPAACGRYRVAPMENYGRGPAIDCFPDVRTANEQQKTELRVGQKAADPPVLLAEESVITPFNQRPGAANYGMVSADGKALAQPFVTGNNYQLALELKQDVRQTIKDTFLNTLFQILVENPNMTATEALLRAQEKGELIAPAMGSQQSEYLGHIIYREVDLLREARQLPPPPKELLQGAGGSVLGGLKGIGIEYTSPLARAMRAEEGTAIMNWVSDIAQMANLDKTVLTVVDMHEAAREMRLIRGAPAKLMRSEEEVDEILQQQQSQDQDAAEAAQAPQVAMGVKNLAQAAQALGATGTGGAGAPSVNQGA